MSPVNSQPNANVYWESSDVRHHPLQREIVLIFVVILLLVVAKQVPDFLRGLGAGLLRFRNAIDQESHAAGESLGGIYGKPAAQALTSDNQTAELYDPEILCKGDGIGTTTTRVSRSRRWLIRKLIQAVHAVVAMAKQRWPTAR